MRERKARKPDLFASLHDRFLPYTSFCYHLNSYYRPVLFMRTSLFLALVSLSLLSGCDRLGLPDPAIEAARKDADARATGSACRHAGRGIEDCYTQNPDSSRAPVYAGWKEMNDYMRENKIEEVKPVISVASASASASSASAEESSAIPESTLPKSKKKSAEH